MSHAISSTLPAINHNDHDHSSHRKQQSSTSATENAPPLQSSNAREISENGRKFNDDISSKAFSSLTGSLERAFSDAVKVDKKTGEEEISRGGLQRVSKDLQKLFKGMGFSPQSAKQYARDISSAMAQDGVEQIDFSLSMTRALTVSGYNQQGDAQPAGEDGAAAGARATGFQLTAIQTRSLDVSINLSTGEFSINRSAEGSITLTNLRQPDGSDPAGPEEENLLAEEPVAAPAVSEDPTAEALEPTTESTTEPDTVSSESALLLQITRTLQQSAIFKQQQSGAAVVGERDPEEDSDATPEKTLQNLQMFAEKTIGITVGDSSLFESLTEINNLRIETIDQQEYLSFNVRSVVPMALTEVQPDGSEVTVYPRPDDTAGEFSTDSVKLSA